MKVKNRNLFELVLQAIILVLIFIDGTITTEIWYHDTTYHASKEASYGYSFLQSSIDNRAILGYLAIVLVIAGVVLFAMQFAAKGDKRNSKIAAYIPVAELILVAVSIIFFSGSDTYGKTEYRSFPGIVFFVLCGLLLVLSIVSVVTYIKAKKTGIEEEVVKVRVVANDVKSSNADELKKYKELLDSGIISQEEFDAKKKQLLGL